MQPDTCPRIFKNAFVCLGVAAEMTWADAATKPGFFGSESKLIFSRDNSVGDGLSTPSTLFTQSYPAGGAVTLEWSADTEHASWIVKEAVTANGVTTVHDRFSSSWSSTVPYPTTVSAPSAGSWSNPDFSEVNILKQK